MHLLSTLLLEKLQLVSYTLRDNPAASMAVHTGGVKLPKALDLYIVIQN